MSDTLTSLPGAALRFLTPLVLVWLAVFFGRTLRRGSLPLIERIARRSTPDLSPAIVRYTRRLTLLWCAYFAVAAMFTALPHSGHASLGLVVWGGTALLFIGERCVRPLLFPGEPFPGLLQQLRDTWSVWRTRP